MLVMDEAFDCWRYGKNADDYHTDFDACVAAAANRCHQHHAASPPYQHALPPPVLRMPRSRFVLVR
jgi:hypothetical protein